MRQLLQLGSTQDCRSVSQGSSGAAAVTGLQPCTSSGLCAFLRVQKGDGDSPEIHAPLPNPLLPPLNPMQLVSLWAKDHLRLGCQTQPTATALCHRTTRATFREGGRGSYLQLTCQLLFDMFWKCLALTSVG